MFHDACSEGNVEEVRRLLACGVNINAKNEFSDWTPLTGACRHERLGVVKVLLEHGADPNAVTLLGNTPLHHVYFSITETALTIIKLLLRYGANPYMRNSNGASFTGFKSVTEAKIRLIQIIGLYPCLYTLFGRDISRDLSVHL